MPTKAVIAIIGGSGVGQFPLEGQPLARQIETEWGAATVTEGRLHGKTVYFLARHGAGHVLPPHRINYRANIAALKQLGVTAIFATTAVGSLRPELSPGTLVLLDDLIDFTRDRTGKTFYDGQPGTPVVHTDLTRPYDDTLRTLLLSVAGEQGVALRPAGVYLCNDGPRYETAAEVRMFALWGGDVAGMTGVPEVPLAREAGIPYAGISVVTNFGAGISPALLSHAEVEEAMTQARPRLTALLAAAVARL